MRDALIKRLALWLAIGNGGGLLAFASKFPDLSTELGAVVIPSLWLFAVGLVSAFVLNISLLADFGRQVDAAESNVPYTPHVVWDPVGGVSAALSCAAFLLGVTYPLMCVSLADYDLWFQ